MLDANQTTITEERPARKQPMSEAEARTLLSLVDEVIISKGKASRKQAAKDTKLDELKGPTGNIRAPLIRQGKKLLVGFHEGELKALLA